MPHMEGRELWPESILKQIIFSKDDPHSNSYLTYFSAISSCDFSIKSLAALTSVWALLRNFGVMQVSFEMRSKECFQLLPYFFF